MSMPRMPRQVAGRFLAPLAAVAWFGAAGAFAGEPPADIDERRAAMEAQRERMRALSPFAMVAAPAGVEVKHLSSGESDRNYRFWHAKADGAISAKELVEHYAAGLQELGWTFRASLEEGAVSLRTGEHQDAEGATWHFVLLAAPSLATPGRCILTIHLTLIE